MKGKNLLDQHRGYGIVIAKITLMFRGDIGSMPKINKRRYSHGWLTLFIVIALFDLGLLIFNLIYGKNIALFDSKGFVAHEQRGLLVFTLVLLFAVAVPTILFLYYTAWKYRETNTKAKHEPNAKHGKGLVTFIWGFPTLILLIMSPILWSATHRLEPHDMINSDKKPITIQVIAMRWKWVFLYPDQKIATVNFVQIPEDTPVSFELTADEAPMSSFWIPNLGGQLYSMTSHVNTLNLMGDTVGDYPGSSAELNGAGFAGMKFTTRVSTAEDFESWIQSVKQSDSVLDKSKYDILLKPSENNKVALYSDYQNDIYAKVVEKYMGSHSAHASHNKSEGHE